MRAVFEHIAAQVRGDDSLPDPRFAAAPEPAASHE
jgi:hypothetical protein